MEVEGSWKGRLWFLFFVWPVIGYWTTKQCFETESDYSVIYFIAITIAWFCWLLGLVKFVKLIKSIFCKRKNLPQQLL